MSKPTAGWTRLGDAFFRKTELYTNVFEPELDLENYIVAGAPYSGAVALLRDSSKVAAYRGPHATKATINIYNCAGSLIREIAWDQGNVKGLGWSHDERLLVVNQHGSVRSYANLYDDSSPFTLGNGAEEHGVIGCRFWSTGFVALLGNNNLIAVNSYDEPRPILLAAPPPGDVLSWTITPPELTESRSVEVLLSIGKTVYVADAAECEDRGLEAGPFRHISTSPDGKFIALFTEDGKVWIISSDFQERLSEYQSELDTPPIDLQWCGNNAVVLAYGEDLYLVGPRGASTPFEYLAPVHLLPDIDGIRILSTDVCDFFQKVPEPCGEVFRLGSTSSASILLDAVTLLDNKSPKADENIQIIKDTLDDAVDVCVQAAGQEYSIHWQKQLLKAASYGKSMLELYNSDDFVDMTETLRVLNAVRSHKIGLPLSLDQYIRLTPERLIQRLCNRQEYLLAIRISEYLRLPSDKIYVHWARRKVRTSKSDQNTLCDEIVRRLKGKRGVSFEEIARAAFDEARGELAIRLLEHEPRAGKQVPLLLSMGEESVALDKAIESGDTDLVFNVLLTLKRQLPLSEFFRTINNRPLATAIVEASALDQDQELLKDLYYQDDRRVDASNLLFSEALSASDLPAVLDKMKMSAKLLRDSKEFLAQVAALEDAQKLLRFQEAFEKDLAQPYIGLSLNETMNRLIIAGHSKRSVKVQTEFKVNEKAYWWIRLRALIKARNWRELEEISKLKKSPIGWEPFYNGIVGAGSLDLASTFIPKCTNLSVPQRIEMWIACGKFTSAGEEAFKAKDRAALEGIREKASGSTVLEIDRFISQLQKGR